MVTWLKIFRPNDSTKKLSQMVLSQVTGNHFGDKNVAQMSCQICSPTPSALNAGAKRSGATCHMQGLRYISIVSNDSIDISILDTDTFESDDTSIPIPIPISQNFS